MLRRLFRNLFPPNNPNTQAAEMARAAQAARSRYSKRAIEAYLDNWAPSIEGEIERQAKYGHNYIVCYVKDFWLMDCYRLVPVTLQECIIDRFNKLGYHRVTFNEGDSGLELRMSW